MEGLAGCMRMQALADAQAERAVVAAVGAPTPRISFAGNELWAAT